MGWQIVTTDATGAKQVSRSFPNEGAAVLFACDLLQAGAEVIRIEGPGDVVIDAETIIQRCGPLGKSMR